MCLLNREARLQINANWQTVPYINDCFFIVQSYQYTLRRGFILDQQYKYFW